MNYEEKYKEAFERAMNIYGASETKDVLQTLETIFPELKKSEDEIFKELLHNLIISNDCTPSSKEIFSIYGKTKEDCIAWLEKQGEQKPTWSEDDNKMLYNIIQRIKQLDHFWNKPSDEKMINWLKSIKPNHWKPGEFQLECLKEVIPNNNTERGCELKDVLTELYNDLKKL